MKHQYTTLYWLFTNFTHGNMLIACNAGDPGLIPESGRSPGEGNGNPLQYFARRIPGHRSLAGYSPWDRKSWTGLAIKPPPPIC